MVKWFKSLNTDNINRGATATVEWTTDMDLTLRRVIVSEREDKSLSAVLSTISVGEVFKTRDYLIAEVLNTKLEKAWIPDEAIAKGTRILFNFENKSGEIVNVDVMLEYEAG